MSRGEDRKIRSDKKRDVKPFISVELKDCIYRMSYITRVPVKDVCERLCIEGMESNSVLSYLSQNFRRDIRIKNTLYLGELNRISIRKRNSCKNKERVSIRFTGDMYESLSVLSYAMDCSISMATGMLLDATIREVNIVNRLIEENIHEELDRRKLEELRKVIKYVNGNSPYDEEISWINLLSYVMDSAKTLNENVEEFIRRWIDK